MTLRIALNGYGRVGRSFVRALVAGESNQGDRAPAVQLVAINDLGEPEDLLYLTRYDSTHGPYPGPVELLDGVLRIGNQTPVLLSEAEPQRLPWKELEVDLVLECTGAFRGYDGAALHLEAGAARVLIGAVAFDRADAWPVYGVNHEDLAADQRILSAASCTTHAVAPMLAELDEQFGIRDVILTEVHAYTSDQALLDHVHRDPRRGRAAAQNIVPTTSSAIGAVQQVLPRLAGRISGGSIRVPTLNVAMVDLTLRLEADMPDTEAVNELFAQAAARQPRLIGYNAEPLVSVDFNHRSESVIFDATRTLVQGDLLRVGGWYDNEWGFANRLLDLVGWLGERH